MASRAQGLGISVCASCMECQQNKSSTTKPIRPLHSLPIHDKQCNSVALDFIGPLPSNGGFDCILTLTDRLGSDVQIIPCTMTQTVNELACIFLTNWYCKNGLPLELISNHDKLFLSQFWQALHKLTGTELKLSMVYHPETNGASEHTNKTVNQHIHYHVK